MLVEVIFGIVLSVLGYSWQIIAWSAIFFIALVVIVFIGFYKRVWTNHITIKAWYGVCNLKNTNDNIILCLDKLSVLYIQLTFGPAVRNWIIRFGVPQECIITSCHKPSVWKTSRSYKSGIVCQASERTDDQIQLAYGIQAGIYSDYVPKIRLYLDGMVNINFNQLSLNQQFCESTELANLDSFDAIIVPI